MQNPRSLDNEDTLAAYFAAAVECFQRAAACHGKRTHNYRVGPFPFTLNFAGPALEPYLTPAFDHIGAAAAAADFEVFLWDSQSTGIAMTAPPWEWRHFVRNEVHIGDRIKIVYNGDSGSLIMYDALKHQAIFWIRQASNVRFYETGAPLLSAMNWWLESRGCQLVHAGAAGTREGGVLLVGRGGSGKSTTALACMAHGLEFAADDYCVLAATGPEWVHSLYCSAKLSADSCARLPELSSAICNSGAEPHEKSLYLLNRIFPDRISGGFPLRAILLPRISDIGEPLLKPMQASLALRALAPSTIFQLAGGGHSAFKTVSSIVRRIPCFEIAVGRDLARIAGVIRALLAHTGEQPHV